MINIIKQHILVCDLCCKRYDDETRIGLSEDSSGVTDEANENGWLITEKGMHYCPECHYVRDDNTLIIKSVEK